MVESSKTFVQEVWTNKGRADWAQVGVQIANDGLFQRSGVVAAGVHNGGGNLREWDQNTYKQTSKNGSWEVQGEHKPCHKSF